MSSPATFTIGGVTCGLKVDGDGSSAIVESLNMMEGAKAKALISCAWASRYQVLRGLAGSVTMSGSSIVRNAPFAYPDSPNLFCTEIESITPRGVAPPAGSGWPQWQKAVIAAVFTVPKWQFASGTPGQQVDASGQPWTTTRFRGSGEVFTPEGNTYKWSSGSFAGQPVKNSHVGVVRPRTEIGMTRHWMPYVPVGFNATYGGTINQNPIQMSDHLYPQGTVLFSHINTEIASDTLGNLTQEVEYVMIANDDDIDWNKYLDPGGSWTFIDTAGNGTGAMPFRYADFYSNMP